MGLLKISLTVRPATRAVTTPAQSLAARRKSEAHPGDIRMKFNAAACCQTPGASGCSPASASRLCERRRNCPDHQRLRAAALDSRRRSPPARAGYARTVVVENAPARAARSRHILKSQRRRRDILQTRPRSHDLPHIYKKLPYDTGTDMSPVSLAASSLRLCGGPAVP